MSSEKVDINDVYGTYDTSGETTDYSSVEDANYYYGKWFWFVDCCGFANYVNNAFHQVKSISKA